MNYLRIKSIYFMLLLLILNLLLVSGRRTIGGSVRRSSSSSRTYSRAVPTARTQVHTQSSNNNYYSGNNYYNTQRKATNVGTTPKSVMHTQPTARNYPQPTTRNYPQVTQKSVYPQQPVYSTSRPSVYQQPAYAQKPVYPQQSSYPQQSYPSFSHPTYRPFGTYSGNNYNPYSPSGGFYHKKDHSVRNSVLAGLGGSALGMYLGYKLGGLTHSVNNPYYGGYGGGSGYGMNPGMPQYSVVHHYHHGDKPVIQNAVVEQNVVTPCKDVNICMANTIPLCMTNGTIYCVTPIDQTTTCKENSTNLPCINATISAPCLNATDGNCNSTQLTTENLQIPCVSNINVFGDFNTNRLQVQGGGGAVNGQSTLTNQGINNRYCVTVIAEPLIEPKNLSNEEYIKYLQKNPYAKEEAEQKAGNVMNSIGAYMFF